MTVQSILTKIKKRNGDVETFEVEKIAIAMQRGFVTIRGGVTETLLDTLTESVITILEKRFEQSVPSVEDVQNAVESILMEGEYFDVAKHYIIYRYEHTKKRAEKKQEAIKKIEEGGLYIVKKSGKKELFSLEKLKKTLVLYCKGYEEIIDIDIIANQCRQEVFEDIATKEIDRVVVMVLRSFIEHDPAYGYAASKALLFPLYKHIIGDSYNPEKYEEQLRVAFVKNMYKAVGVGRLDPRVLTFDLDELAAELDFSRDFFHTYLSTQTLIDRYFLNNPETSEVYETPQFFWMRVAIGLSLKEKDPQKTAKDFYGVMSTLAYIPSTPTLFHSATAHPQMSSCYLTTIEDSLDHIFKSIGDNAQLSKWSGGIGNDWTNLRGTGALIKGTGVPSQGTVPFLKIANDTTAAINRSGRRRGATCAYMEVWHWDIEDFLELRKNTGDERRRTHDMNTAAWVPDLFIKRLKTDGEWTLFSPDETPDLHHLYGKDFEARYEAYEKKAAAGEMVLHKTIKVKDLWKKMITMLFETGHPWITFKDPCNVRSPQDHVGTVHSSNLCTEITLNTSSAETAVCNLGSVNISRHISGGALDKDKLKKTVRVAMNMLDNVIDLNFYPTKEAKYSNMRNRPVGIGMMGFQDALYQLGINFDSEEGIAFADNSMEAVSYYAIEESSNLAKERGVYETYRGSKWDRGIFPKDTIQLLEQERGSNIDVDMSATMDWVSLKEKVQKQGMRNSNCMAIAPTATISNIAGCTPTIEPMYKNIFVKANQAGDFTIVNPFLVAELKGLKLWDAEMLGKLKYNDGSIAKITEIPQDIKDRYKEVFEIAPEWLIRAAAQRGKWIDQSQSLNIFYNGKSGRELSAIYLRAWDKGLKTTYYLRSLGASQVEKSTVKIVDHGVTHTRNSAETPSTASSAIQKVGIMSLSGTAKDVAELPMNMGKNVPSQTTSLPKIAPKIRTGVVPQQEPQLCKIEDPDCEACQ